MTFRREALAGAPRLALRRGVTGEDIDLCWTLVGRGARLAIATDARIVHSRAPHLIARHGSYLTTGRTSDGTAERRPTPASFAWYVTGVLVRRQAPRFASEPGAAGLALTGLQRVRNDYAGRFSSPARASAEAVALFPRSQTPHQILQRRRTRPTSCGFLFD